MTVEGIFGFNHGLETVFNAQLTATVSTLENTLETAFPDVSFRFISSDEHQPLWNIVRSARDLSLKMQSAHFSSRLVVTKTPAINLTNKVFGTYTLGVDRISETERKTLLEAKPITLEQLSPFFE